MYVVNDEYFYFLDFINVFLLFNRKWIWWSFIISTIETNTTSAMTAFKYSISLKFTHGSYRYLASNSISGKMFAYSVLALKSPFRYSMLSSVDRRFFPLSNAFFVCWFKRNIFPLAFNSFIFISSLYFIRHHCAAFIPATFLLLHFGLAFRYVPLIITDPFRPSNKHQPFIHVESNI